jgi:ribonucleotide monophosphatase NagD (HAD superfamily)
MRIAIDLDGVILEKGNGELIPGAVDRIKQMRVDGHHITIFTAHPDWDAPTIEGLLRAAGIPYDRVQCGKPAYDIFIDDRARHFVGWHLDYTKTKELKKISQAKIDRLAAIERRKNGTNTVQ